MKRILFIISFLLYYSPSFSQIISQKTANEFTLKMETDSIIRHLTFWKEQDSVIYTGCKYSYTKLKVLVNPIDLGDEVLNIEILWALASDSIKIQLNRVFIGYPEEYSDIFTNHVLAFIASANWQNHVKDKGKTLDYDLIHQVMIDYNVYKPLHDFLLTKAYRISGFLTEKHGFATIENLKKAGFTGQEIIPLPFMVWINLESIKE